MNIYHRVVPSLWLIRGDLYDNLIREVQFLLDPSSLCLMFSSYSMWCARGPEPKILPAKNILFSVHCCTKQSKNEATRSNLVNNSILVNANQRTFFVWTLMAIMTINWMTFIKTQFCSTPKLSGLVSSIIYTGCLGWGAATICFKAWDIFRAECV